MYTFKIMFDTSVIQYLFNLTWLCPLSFETGGTMGYNCCFFLNFVPLHIESSYNFGGTGSILGVKNPLQRVNGNAVMFIILIKCCKYFVLCLLYITDTTPWPAICISTTLKYNRSLEKHVFAHLSFFICSFGHFKISRFY